MEREKNTWTTVVFICVNNPSEFYRFASASCLIPERKWSCRGHDVGFLY